MTELIALEDKIIEEENLKKGSLNHGVVQGQITGLLFADKRFRAIY